jgi:hypothetical protein
MSEEDFNHENLDETLRAIAREVSSAAERFSQIDLDEVAESFGVDPSRARDWVESAGSWLRVQSENIANEGVFTTREPVPEEDPLRGAAPHPLDMPTEEQGLALAALDSGRCTVEPGRNVLSSHGAGPTPPDAPGLVDQLRARDWVATDGQVTIAGRHALTRWLEASTPH